MFAKREARFWKTLTGRLTIIFTLLSGLLSVLMALFLYFFFIETLNQQYDDALMAYAGFGERILNEKGIEALQEELLVTDEDDPDSSEGFVRLLSEEGSVIAASDLSTWPNLTFDKDIFQRIKDQKWFFTSIKYVHRKNPIRALYWRTDNGLLFQVGFVSGNYERIIEQFTTALIIVSFVIIGLSYFIGYFIANRAMAGLKKVTMTAGAISEGELSARVPSSDQPEEIQQLASAFNSMIDRIESLIEELKGVGNNIAHDLRRPLTRIRGNVEVTLRGESDLDDYKAMSQRVVEDCDMLESMINTMLEIAALDSGIIILKKEEVNLSELLSDAEDLFMVVAEEENQVLEFLKPTRPVFMQGDRSKLQRTVANLLDNALKFTPENGKIVVKLESTDAYINLLVQDNGPGISPENLIKVFDPFFREDKSRTKPGNGLGLSYVKTIVERHRGTILVSRPKKGGTLFSIQFPGSC